MFDGMRFGIEIETANASRESLARAIASAIGGTVSRGNDCVTDGSGRDWRLVADSSIRSTNGLSAEVVSPILDYSDMASLQEVVRALRAAGAQVNNSTGIHVHVDVSGLDGRQLSNLAKTVSKQEPLIRYALAIVPGRDHFCAPIDPAFIGRLETLRTPCRDAVRAAWYGTESCAAATTQRYHHTRYRGLNFHSVWYRGTAEFRWFNGTLHAGKVKAYIQLCLAIVRRAAEIKRAQATPRALDLSSAGYDFRVFLLSLGLIGDEFKTARKHLLEGMPGDRAWKGRRRREERPEWQAPRR